MIDTDKYEGHTPALWKWIIDDKDTYLSCFDNDIKADENLIEDAPLLFAEVKRLREQIVDMIDSMDNHYIRDIQHATDCLRDMIGYYEDEEE